MNTIESRKFQAMRQIAWRRTRDEYKDDPELCFALGFDAGVKAAQEFGAVAPRDRAPGDGECGGFESRPAPPELLDALRVAQLYIELSRDTEMTRYAAEERELAWATIEDALNNARDGE